MKSDLMKIYLWLIEVVSSMKSELTIMCFIKGNNEQRNIWDFHLWLRNFKLILNQFKYIILKMFQRIIRNIISQTGACAAFIISSCSIFSLFLCYCSCCRHDHRLSLIFNTNIFRYISCYLHLQLKSYILFNLTTS